MDKPKKRPVGKEANWQLDNYTEDIIWNECCDKWAKWLALRITALPRLGNGNIPCKDFIQFLMELE
jgi:hypothetical protein